jgi:calcineurin-like phosphoesterase family protein
VDRGKPLIHGHIHNTNRNGVTKDNMFHVGVDVHDYYPVPESTIIDWMRSLP